jgi:hypothetical protein
MFHPPSVTIKGLAEMPKATEGNPSRHCSPKGTEEAPCSHLRGFFFCLCSIAGNTDRTCYY